MNDFIGLAQKKCSKENMTFAVTKCSAAVVSKEGAYSLGVTEKN